MKTKPPNIQYDYIVHNISSDDDVAYKAIIPAFDAVVFGENLAELEAGIALAIDEEIKNRKKQKQKLIPKPDRDQQYSGKFMVRIEPALHEKLALEAKARGKSLNAHIKEKIK